MSKFFLAALSLLVFNVANAENCSISGLEKNALAQAQYELKQDRLYRPTFGSQLSLIKTRELQPNLFSKYTGEPVAEFTVVSKVTEGSQNLETGRVVLRLFNDDTNSCDLRVYKKTVMSSYEICRELRGYEGRIGNAYDPCVE